jgi:hypothetical protein
MEAAMRSRCQIRCECRLTVLGTKRDVRRFESSAWEKILRARYYDPLQLSPCRFVCQFETDNQDSHGLKRLQRLSRSHPALVLLLDFELFPGRIKGLAKAKAGELEHCEISY